jgi:uncharacterized protein with HEPN domain
VIKDDRLYLIHIKECIDRIDRYRSNGRAGFFADTMIQDAIVRNLQTLAESTQRLSDTTKSKKPDVDWRAIAAFRNVVVHDYLGVDLEQIWHIVERDLPEFKSHIEALLIGIDESPPPAG